MKCRNDDQKRKDEDKLLYDIHARDQSALIFRIAGKAILIAAIGFIVWSVITKANAHSWYEIECCDTRDCRPISGVRNGEPWSEIQDQGDRYVWKSSHSGQTHIIPKGDSRIRPSRNAHYHACEVSGDVKPDSFAKCLYIPTLF